MIDLTPERRAELRAFAERARPFVRHGGTSPAAVYVPAADLLTLLDAADARDRLIEVESRLSVLWWRLTNGRLSKTSYPVEFMEQEIEECLAKYHESDLRDERDRLEVVVEEHRPRARWGEGHGEMVNSHGEVFAALTADGVLAQLPGGEKGRCVHDRYRYWRNQDCRWAGGGGWLAAPRHARRDVNVVG